MNCEQWRGGRLIVAISVRGIWLTGYMLVFAGCAKDTATVPSNGTYGPPPTQGLAAYYNFNRNANDASGNGNNATPVNNPSPAKDRFGHDSSAYTLNGSNQLISLPSTIKVPQNLTVSFWIQTAASDSNRFPSSTFIIDRDACGFERDWSICMGEGGRIQFNTGTLLADSVLTSSRSINNGAWRNVVIVRDTASSLKKIYIDGQLDTFIVFDSEPFLNLGLNINVGASLCSALTHTYYRGNIDDIRIYNRAVTDVEVQELYHEGGW